MVRPRRNAVYPAAVRLFVYGSLLSGEENHGALLGARFVGAARTAPRYTLVSLGRYPALVVGGRTAVVGELYDVDDARMVLLDEFEGVPEHYLRVDVDVEGGEPAQGYVLAPHRVGDLPIIASGDWRARGA
jgi:gamma-glutamylaminecyclotransferase